MCPLTPATESALSSSRGGWAQAVEHQRQLSWLGSERVKDEVRAGLEHRADWIPVGASPLIAGLDASDVWHEQRSHLIPECGR